METLESQAYSQEGKDELRDSLIPKLPTDSREEVVSELVHTPLIPISTRVLSTYVNNLETINPDHFLEQLRFQRKLSEMFFESKEISDMYVDSGYRLGVLDFRFSILETMMILPGEEQTPQEIIDSIQQIMTSYRSLYTYYRDWNSKKGKYPQVVDDTLAVAFDQLLNDYNAMDTTGVDYILKTLSTADEVLSIIEDSLKGAVNISSYKWDTFHYDEIPYDTFFTYFARYYIDQSGEDNYVEIAGQDIILTEDDVTSIMGKISERYPSKEIFSLPLLASLSDERTVDLREYMYSPIPSADGVPQKQPEIVTTPESSVEVDPLMLQDQLISQLLSHSGFPGRVTRNTDRNTIITDRILGDVLDEIKDLYGESGFQEKFFASLQIAIVPGSQQSLDFTHILYEKQLITSDQLYVLLWGERGFQRGGISYSDVIDVVGIPKGAIDALETIRGTSLTTAEIENLESFTKMMLYCESSGGYNIRNDAGISSAENIAQYLTQNGRRNANGTRATNSYETALKRLPSSLDQDFPIFASEREKIGQPGLQSPMQLGPVEQLVLFYGDVYDQHTSRFEAILAGNGESALKMYGYQHHTNMDRRTMDLLEEAYEKNYGAPVRITRNNGIYTFDYSTQVDGSSEGENENGDFSKRIQSGDTPAAFLMSLIQEFNPNTGIEQRDILLQLNGMEPLSFPAGGNVSIKRPGIEGVAYSISLNGAEILRVENDGIFISS